MRSYDAIAADARPGRAFSNSTHFEVWANNRGGCYSCRNDGMGVGKEEPQCPIFAVALIEGTTPREWTDTDPNGLGYYTCSEYDERPDDDGPDDDPAPPPDPDPHPGQLDIFSVFADQVIEQTSTMELEAQR